MNILDFQKMKHAHQKISMLTCYDFVSAQIANASDVDCLLVGDSAAMVMHGFKNTVNATIEMMCMHTAAVARGAPDKFIIGDMPFLSYRQDLSHNMQAVLQLMQSGCHAIKLEGASGNLELIKHCVDSGVPVMGHLGLTPQSVHQLGGMRVQAREQHEMDQLMRDALALQQAGCFALVLECIPTHVAKWVTEQLAIPTIGIGAGPYTSGQVLVWQDLLGMQCDFKPKFVKQYLPGFDLIRNALNDYNREVKSIAFPDVKANSYLNKEPATCES